MLLDRIRSRFHLCLWLGNKLLKRMNMEVLMLKRINIGDFLDRGIGEEIGRIRRERKFY